MSADVIAVISAERTAGTSVAESIRFHFPETEALHVHYLDRAALSARPDAQGDEAAQALKREREAQVRRGLALQGRLRVVFSILRAPADRLASVIWYDHAEELLAGYRSQHGGFTAKADALVRRRIDDLTLRGVDYTRAVYAPLGIAAPSPGRWRAEDGMEIFLLRFETLEADFQMATAALLGYPLRLLRLNAARAGGEAGAYAAFRQAFAGPIAAAAGQAPTLPSPRDPCFDLAAETVASFPAHEHRRALKRSVRAAEQVGVEPAGIADGWRRVLAAAPGDLQAMGGLAEAASTLGDHAGAADMLARLAAARPAWDKGWRKLAEARRLAGDAYGELQALEAVLGLNPSDQGALSRTTRLLSDLGRSSEAADFKARLRAAIADQSLR